MSELNQNKSFNYSSFSEFCFHKDDLPPETRHTVEVLLKVAGINDYLEAERVLLNEPGLHLDDCNITDLSPLGTLKKLTYVNLSENKIYDLTPLQELKNLIDLDLSDNQIQDINPLETLINLNVLYLDFNKIHDIKPLKSLTNIQELYLHLNYIKDVVSLKNLVKLESLTLDDNQIIDISSLKKLTNLTSLSISRNQIDNLNSIKSLHKLCFLDVSFNKITDFGSFQEFKDINHLHIQGNPISESASPTNLIEKYQKLLSVPLNRQKVIEAINLVYTSIGLKVPKVLLTKNYKYFYTEAINLLKSNHKKNNQDREYYINQKSDEKAKIISTLYNRSLDFLYEEHSPIRKTVIRELIQVKFNNSEFIRQIHSISQIIQFHLAYKLLCESSLGKYSQACICLNNVTPEEILHQIYLIETYQSLLKIPLDGKTQQWYDCLTLFYHFRERINSG